MFHSLISAGSHKVSAHFQLGSAMRFTSEAFCSQWLVSLARNSAVKGPQYAMKPAASAMSPQNQDIS